MPSSKLTYRNHCIETILNIKKDEKPSLLLHACCGPCSCYPLTFLCPHFKVTIFYSNSNIAPLSEYERRLDELKKFLLVFKRDYGYDVSLIVPSFEGETFIKELSPFSQEPEGGKRCALCYELRLKATADYALSHNFAYFATVMTVSRQKDAVLLNSIGDSLASTRPGLIYLPSDFKKERGIDVSQQMRLHYGLYSQSYCGCPFSLLNKGQYRGTKDKDWQG